MSAIVLDSSQLTAAIRSTLVGQLAVYGVSFPEHVITAMTNNIAQSVVSLEVDDTHVVDAPTYCHAITPDPSNGGLYACSCGVRWMSLEQANEHRRLTHRDRCLSPHDDEHMTCPVVGGRVG